MALRKISTTTTANGAGYYAVKQGRVVIVEIVNWDGTSISLPWPPAYRARGTLFQTGSTAPARCNANTTGQLDAYDMTGNGALWGQVTYIT